MLVVVLTLLVAVPLLVNGALRLRSDAWFHAAVSERIAQGGLPPDDPFYAGLQLRYFWGYHVYLLVLRSACGLSLFDLMASLNVLVFALYLLGVHSLSRRLDPESRGSKWAMVLAVFGINVFGGVLLLGRAFFGETRGFGALNGVLRSGVVVVHQNLSYRYLHSLAFVLDKFLVGTPFGMALVILLCFLGAAIDWLSGKHRSSLILAGLCYGAALFFHAVVGLSILICAGAAFAGTALSGRIRTRHGGPPLGIYGVLMLAVTTAALSPYLTAIISFTGRGSVLPLAANGAFLWTLLAVGILPLCLVVFRLIRRRPTVSGEMFLYLFIVAVVILGTFARLPLGNAYKFVYIASLPMIALAGGMVPDIPGLLRGLGGMRYILLAALCLCAVATVSFGVAGCILDPGVDVPVPVSDGMPSLTNAEEEGYRWIRERTPDGSIMINANRRDILVLGPRRQLWTQSTYAEAWGYAPDVIEWRRVVVQALYTERSLPADAWVKMFAFDQPLYLIVRSDDPGSAVHRKGGPSPFGRYREVFSNEEFLIFEILPRFE